MQTQLADAATRHPHAASTTTSTSMMAEWNLPSILAKRVDEDREGVWKRIQAWYQAIGQDQKLDRVASLVGALFQPDCDYGITLQNFTFGEINPLEKPIEASTRTYQNDGDTEILEEFAFTKALEESFTFGFTEGLKVGTRATTKIKLPLIGESEIELNAEMSFDASEEWTRRETKEWSLKSTVPVPPRSTVKVTGFISNARLDTTFSGQAVATRGLIMTRFELKDGKGFTEIPIPLVVLLTAEQRSVPLSGRFRGVEGVSAWLHVENVSA